MAKLQRASIYVLSAGSVGFGLLGLARPARLAAMMGADEKVARAIGVRDLTNGIVLLRARDPRAALLSRALFDVSDALRYGRGRPAVLAGALGFAALALVTLWKTSAPA